ncbi:MAG: hypothetical protein LBL13_10745 [Bacteroidales bacterium]|jgi:hypothetical protein|nr:hypothetical protein [Bacteroidales bacterium]
MRAEDYAEVFEIYEHIVLFKNMFDFYEKVKKEGEKEATEVFVINGKNRLCRFLLPNKVIDKIEFQKYIDANTELASIMKKRILDI